MRKLFNISAIVAVFIAIAVLSAPVHGAELWSGYKFNISATEMTWDLVSDGSTDNLPPLTNTLVCGERYYFNLGVTYDITVFYADIWL